MDKKKKIIAIIACVTVIAGILCISSFAYNDFVVEEDITITMNYPFNGLGTYIFDFKVGGTNLANKLEVMSSTSAVATLLNNTSYYLGNSDRSIIISADQTLPANVVEYLVENTNFPPPPPPPPAPLPEAISNVKETFSFTLTFGTLIISWLIANQIALVGLYLYILISLIAVMKRFFVT